MNLDLRNRQQLLVVIALVLVAFFVGERLVLRPLIASWNERSDRIAKLRHDLAQGRQTLLRERNIRDRWDGIRTNSLPGIVSTAEGSMLRAFDRWSADSRISVTSVKPQWKHPGEDYMTLECRVDAYGSLAALTRFLYEVEGDPLGVRVDSLELSTRESDGSQLTLGLQVNGLFLNPPEL